MKECNIWFPMGRKCFLKLWFKHLCMGMVLMVRHPWKSIRQNVTQTAQTILWLQPLLRLWKDAMCTENIFSSLRVCTEKYFSRPLTQFTSFEYTALCSAFFLQTKPSFTVRFYSPTYLLYRQYWRHACYWTLILRENLSFFSLLQHIGMWLRNIWILCSQLLAVEIW